MADKCKLVDQATFDKLQQSTSNASQSSSSRKVRNAKYKRMSANDGFDLLLFLKKKCPIEAEIKKGKQRPRRIETDTNKKNLTKKGKQCETGAKQVRSRLKKSILRYRQTKRAQEQQLQPVETTVKQQELAVERDEINNVNVKVGQIHSRRFRGYVQSLIIIFLSN